MYVFAAPSYTLLSATPVFPGIIVYAESIEVRYQATDAAFLQVVESGGTWNPKKGLSTGAKIGIGVGAGVGGILLIFFVVVVPVSFLDAATDQRRKPRRPLKHITIH
jgi:hypothetical protein